MVRLIGPSLVSVPVRAVRDLDGEQWVLDNKTLPGVTVVESPLASAISVQGHGVVTLRVDPGVETLLSPVNPPWTIGSATSELEELAEVSFQESVRLSRVKARTAGVAGLVRSSERELFLSVKLSS